MTATWILARNTFREAIRDRLLSTVVVFGVVLVAASIVLAPLTLGEQEKVVRDLGLSAVSGFTMLLIILVGTGMVYREFERRTIDTILTQPVGRAHFILGKFFGLYLSVLASLLALGAVYLGIVALFGGGVRPGLLVALGLTALEALLVTAVAIFFSTLASPLLSALFTFLAILAGHFGETLADLANESGNAVLAAVTGGMYFLLPSLHQFDVRNNVLSGLPVASGQITGCAGYSLLYAGALLLVTIVVFERRDLE
jgi:ABC-type transport system involved in multi-copper enzyme maturation permease subunit